MSFTSLLLSKKCLHQAQTLLEPYEGVAKEHERSESKPSQRELIPALLQEKYRHAGIGKEKAAKEGLLFLAALFVCLAITISLQSLLPLLVWGGALLLLFVRLQRLTFQRAQSFENDYTALLVSLVTGVRTGLDPLDALLRTKNLFPEKSVMREELVLLQQKIDRGERELTAISTFAESVPHPDVELFRSAFILARKEGSSLSDCLQRLAKVTRQRQSFRRKIRGAVAMQKLSAFGIGACALIIAGIQASTNLQAFLDTIKHPFGIQLLVGGGTLILAGISWMISMTRQEI